MITVVKGKTPDDKHIAIVESSVIVDGNVSHFDSTPIETLVQFVNAGMRELNVITYPLPLIQDVIALIQFEQLTNL